MSFINDPIIVSIQFRGNPIEEISEVANLKCLPFLRALILSGNRIVVPYCCATIIVDCPVCETDEYRLEVLIAIRTLERLDKDVYEQDERQDAEEVRNKISLKYLIMMYLLRWQLSDDQ